MIFNCRGVPVYQFHPICTGSSPEWHDWQVITAAALESRPMHSLCRSIIAQARRSFSDKAGKGWFDPSGNAPSVDLCHQIADVLRPQFEFYEAPATRRRNKV